LEASLKMKRQRHSASAAALVLLVLWGCGAAQTSRYAYAPPEATADGWPTGDLRDHGMDIGPISALFDAILDGSYVNIHAVLIIKDGTLVVEEYFPGAQLYHPYSQFNRDTLHELHSVTKSVNVTLLGMAACDGLIKDLDEPVATFFPEYADVFADPGKRRIRLRHLLAMTAGLEWHELNIAITDPLNSPIAMAQAPDPIRWVLERPLVNEPGSTFVYNSGISNVLGAIVEKVTGLRADAFAARHLFPALGIVDYDWYIYPSGFADTMSGLMLRPRDMAKIGFLYLNGGSWKGQQVLCKDWVTESTKQQAPDAEYGYQWWLDRFLHLVRPVARGYSARGRAGQFIFVVPEQALVVVFTGANDNERWIQPQEIMGRFILPSVTKVAE
jgi:CubicO group peptidase (beta-lactamase class C family)